MSNPKQTGPIRQELTELKQKIVSAVTRINDAKDDRAESNAIIAEQIAAMEACGIPRKAIQWAMAYQSWDADARQGFDVAYQIVREAIGSPVEDQLFDTEGKPNLKIPSIAEDDKKKNNGEGIAGHVLTH